MGAILLIIDMILQQGESMTIKSYGNRHSYGSMFFNAMICFFSMVFFIITDKGGLTFNKDLVAYGLLIILMMWWRPQGLVGASDSILAGNTGKKRMGRGNKKGAAA